MLCCTPLGQELYFFLSLNFPLPLSHSFLLILKHLAAGLFTGQCSRNKGESEKGGRGLIIRCGDTKGLRLRLHSVRSLVSFKHFDTHSLPRIHTGETLCSQVKGGK